MSVRRVVTGHAADGKAIVVSDEQVDGFAIGSRGTSATSLWGRDEPGRFPDDGARPAMAAPFPAPGGSGIAVITLAADGDDFHDFVGGVLAAWADPGEPGMHRTATHDYDFVLEGTIGLELDDGVEVILGPGDLVVQNGTRHRWHNRGATTARYLAVTVGAYNAIEGGAAVPPPR
jgi:mannose-6-phosphate isomerase-like protein (cupin superfamily)